MEKEGIAIKLTEHHKEIESLKHRMNDCEKVQEETNALIRSVDRLAINMENLFEEQKNQGQRLTYLEQAPVEKFEYYKRLIFGCLLTGILGTILGALFARLM